MSASARRSGLAWSLLAAALTVTAVACGGPDSGAAPGGPRDRLIFAAAADATTLDPHNTTDTESDQVIMMVYEPLIAFDDAMAIRPRLAERWSVADDGVTWTFHLRAGVRFHDGTPFDAEAVRLNFVRVLDPVANHKRQSLFSMIDRVEVVDPLTVRFVTKFPFGAFEPTLAHVSSAIVSPAVAAAHGKAFGTPTAAVSGTGPYRVAGWKKDQEVVLERFDGYWGDPGVTREIVYRPIPEAAARVLALESGDVDVISRIPATDIPRLESRGDVAVHKLPGVGAQQFRFNVATQALRRPARAAGGVAGHRPAGDRPQPGRQLRPAVDERADADHARLHQPRRDRLRPGQGAAAAGRGRASQRVRHQDRHDAALPDGRGTGRGRRRRPEEGRHPGQPSTCSTGRRWCSSGPACRRRRTRRRSSSWAPARRPPMPTGGCGRSSAPPPPTRTTTATTRTPSSTG